MIRPIKTEPVFKQYIWGGSALKDKYNKKIEDNFAAESWEISCHEDGLSKAFDGDCKGMTLKEIIESDKDNMLGDKSFDCFPLLVKLLDANNNLSVQVHPDDEYATINENGSLGKTEMWYVIDAKPGAKLVYGFKNNTTKEMFKEAVEAENLEPLLNFVEVKKGDAFFIPAKTLHAIGEGLLIAEIQQSSNTTYRVYDYNRVDAQGNKRPLHTEKALDVTSLENVEGKEKINVKYDKDGDSLKGTLVNCDYFSVIKYVNNGKVLITPPQKRFEMLVFVEGEGKIICSDSVCEVNAGDSVFMPAAIGAYSVEGKCEFLRSYVPCTEELSK